MHQHLPYLHSEDATFRAVALIVVTYRITISGRRLWVLRRLHEQIEVLVHLDLYIVSIHSGDERNGDIVTLSMVR